jgi:hypothetical protein
MHRRLVSRLRGRGLSYASLAVVSLMLWLALGLIVRAVFLLLVG